MAGKFRFRLQPVLEQRKRLEQERQLRVAEIERQRISVEDRLATIQREIEDARSDLRTRLRGEGGTIVASEVRMQAGASMHASARARQTALELAGVLSRLDRARADLLQAARAHKAVELLKERRLAEWRNERARVEAAAVDEAGMQQFIRSSRTTQGGES